MTVLLLILLALLAFANGANDNSKGVATLVGYGSATPRQALLWAMVTTAIGAALSFWLSGGLLDAFKTGLFTRGTSLSEAFYVAVLAGAFGWVILATRTGLPVSTTHAITGALTGAGLVSFGTERFHWGFLGQKIALPMAISPLLSLALVYLCAWPVAWLASRVVDRCACVVDQPLVQLPADGAAAMAASIPGVVMDEEAACATQSPAVAVSGTSAVNVLHWLTSGLVGFARGWNDTPKIAALGLVALHGPGGTAVSFGVVAMAMAAGGLIAGRRVLETLAKKMTALPLPEALTASMTTAALVSLASWRGLPVSTTHVSTGAILGAGIRKDPRGVRWGKVGEIALSWLITLPVAALIAAAVKAVLH